jgi:hypothetical protein
MPELQLTNPAKSFHSRCTLPAGCIQATGVRLLLGIRFLRKQHTRSLQLL